MRHAESERLTQILIEAVEDAGVRAVIAQATSDIGSGLHHSENIFALKEYPIPHHVLFPRLKAAVHHGSWITTHFAAQAGIPQLVLPQASDQYQWADRVAKNGLGPKGVDMNRLQARKLSAGLEQLTTRPEYEANAKALGERVRGIDGAKNALALFERIKGRLEKKVSVTISR
jgi:UDP:flavonoid glycosyltransferase YjiC (YdhE family)